MRIEKIIIFKTKIMRIDFNNVIKIIITINFDARKYYSIFLKIKTNLIV